jgi:NAD(P)-dependent dehydrogenase (short-subunit alcohol dehydrogenase family)
MTTDEKMGRKLDGKTALVTGGTGGIGLATAKRFVAEGAYVFITGRREKELASVVLCASVVASKGLPSNSVYSATKAAVRSFARTWADLRSRRIRMNAVSPGSTDTPWLSELLGSSETGQQRLKMISNVVPLGKPDEIAKAVVFLASDDASYVTGDELFVDGGFAQV